MHYRYFILGILLTLIFVNCGSDDTLLPCEEGDFNLSYENFTLVIGGSSFSMNQVSAGTFSMGSPVSQESGKIGTRSTKGTKYLLSY